MKQQHDYDCGHISLRYHGIEPEDKGRPLNTGEIVSYAKSKYPTINFVHPLLTSNCFILIKKGNHGHWLSTKKGKCLDPHTGSIEPVRKMVETYKDKGYKVVLTINM
jgi:hypothetical protein